LFFGRRRRTSFLLDGFQRAYGGDNVAGFGLFAAGDDGGWSRVDDVRSRKGDRWRVDAKSAGGRFTGRGLRCCLSRRIVGIRISGRVE
jgi:hypothetical protein